MTGSNPQSFQNLSTAGAADAGPGMMPTPPKVHRFSRWWLSHDLKNRFSELIEEMKVEGRVKSVLLVTDGGAPLVFTGWDAEADSVGALGIGAFHAMSRLMELCGLGEGRMVYHQGAEGGILMAALDRGAAVILVLPKNGSPGLARFVLLRRLDELNRMIVETGGSIY